jgi:hypothetical protein
MRGVANAALGVPLDVEDIVCTHRVHTRLNEVQKFRSTRAATVGSGAPASHGPAETAIVLARYTRRMNTPESVVGCSSCGALYTPGPGDRGVCLDCRRAAAAAQPRPPSGNAPRPTTAAPVRLPSRPPPVRSALRPNFAKWRALWRIGIAAVVAGGVGTVGVTQRQHISTEWTKLQRHGVSKEWASIQRKASELWVAIRRDTPWPVVEGKKNATASGGTRSNNRDATATRGTSHHTQFAATSPKRKKKRGYDMSTPGSSP